jgi:hypothetical protein
LRNTRKSLRKRDGELIGVALGITPQDEVIAVKWAENDGPQRHFEFVYRGDNLDDHSSDGNSIESPIESRIESRIESPIENPWTGIIGDNPFFIVGHNSALAIASGVTRVSGQAVALALMRTEEFQQAHAQDQPSSYVLFACSTAAPGGSAADFQRTLAYYGYTAPVIAATGVAALDRTGLTGIERGHRWIKLGPRHVEVGFRSGQKALADDSARTLHGFADTVANEVRQRNRRVVVHIEGGGNGGRLSEGATNTGLLRARAVEHALNAQLAMLGVPAAAVEISSASRGDGVTRSPYRQSPGPVADQRRRVMAWIAGEPEGRVRARIQQQSAGSQRGSAEPGGDADTEIRFEDRDGWNRRAGSPSRVTTGQAREPEAAVSTTGRVLDLRDLVDGGELDLLAAEVMSEDPVIAARTDERGGRLAGAVAEAFRRVLADTPESDAPLTLTARIPDSPAASIIAGPAATELGHRIVLRVASRTPVNLCP